MTSRRDRLPSLALALLLPCLGAALAEAERLPLQNFTIRDGLPSDSINCLVRDRLGFLWICTTEGLAHYDGFTFRSFTTQDGLPDRNVNAVLPARDGTYWIATDAGLVRFRPSGRAVGQSRFTVVRLPAPANWFPDKVIANRVLSLLEDRAGRIWCGTAQAGLFLVETTGDEVRLTLVPPELPIDTQINALAEGDDGTLWVGTQRGLLRRSPAGFGEWLGYGEGLATAPGVVYEEITSLLTVGSRVFVGTRYSGLHVIPSDARPGRRAVMRSWRSPSAQGGDGVNGLIAASDGHLWYGGPGGAREIATEAGSDPSVRLWGARDGLGPSDVFAVAEDTAGDIWIGTDGAGLYRLRRGGFTTFTVADGLAGDQVKDLFMARGALHVVTGNNRGLFLNRFDGLQFTAAPQPFYIDQLAWGTNQIALNDRTGAWWFATWNGAVQTPRGPMETVGAGPMRRIGTREGVWSNQVFKLFEDSRGDVWIGTFAGHHNVSLWRRESGRIERHEERTFPYEDGRGFGFVPEVFAETTRGAIWTGSAHGDVARYRDGRWAYFDEAHGAPAGRIQAMHVDRRGRLWIGSTSSGLARVDEPDADQPVFTPIRKTDGLSSDLVLALTEGLDGHLYVGTGLGVDRLDPDTLDVRRYGVEDGLPSGRVVSAFRDPQGDLWFGTNQGLSRFRPTALTDPGWPELRIMQVTAPELEVGISDLGQREVPELELQPHQNAVTITVGALASGPMPGLRFEGRLEGSSSDWVPVEPGRPVMLLNLQPGAYRFVARASVSGRTGPSTVSVPFTILRPWWLRPWALLFGGLGLVGVAAVAYNLRVRQLLAIERVRAGIASDLHDDLGGSLSRVALLSDAARGHTGADRELVVLGTLGEIASTARAMAAQMADIVWANDPRHDTVGNVVGRASWFASELFAIRGTSWRCTVDEAAAQWRVGPDQKRHLLMLLKEALNNVAKHADAREASLATGIVHGRLSIVIEDDGCGFDGATARDSGGGGKETGNGKAGGNGLRNMESRARALGGTCTVSSSLGNGCRIVISLP